MNAPDLSARQRQLRNLVVMAMADGQISEGEVNLIADRCAELELDEQELQQAVAYGLGEQAALELPDNHEAREALLVDLIKMMGADGTLDESEKRLFALAAVKMEVSSEDLDRLIESTLK